jgi:hypothetical protein
MSIRHFCMPGLQKLIRLFSIYIRPNGFSLHRKTEQALRRLLVQHNIRSPSLQNCPFSVSFSLSGLVYCPGKIKKCIFFKYLSLAASKCIRL